MVDIVGMMKKAQELQAKMQETQEALALASFDGQAGGGAVRLTLSGKGALQAISIDPSLLDPNEKDMLEDLILAAFADAKGKADKAASDKMQQVTAGLPLPPGLKLPF
jgi:DNA-binding YbaB/EbfC family protein